MIQLWRQVGLLFICLTFTTKWHSQNFIQTQFIKVISCMMEWKISFFFGHWLALASSWVLLLPHLHPLCSFLCSQKCHPNTFAESGFLWCYLVEVVLSKELLSTPNTFNTQESSLPFLHKSKATYMHCTCTSTRELP